MSRRIGANQKRRKLQKRRNAFKKTSFFMKSISVIIKAGCVAIVVVLLCVIGIKKISKHVNISDYCKMEKIKLKGIKHIDTTDILENARLNYDVSLLNLDISGIVERIKKNQWVKKVNVRRVFPHTVVIKVVEREPIAIVNLGSVYLVGRENVLWPVKKGEYWNLPVISGLKDTIINGNIHKLKDNEFNKMKDFIDNYQCVKNSISRKISQVDFRDNDMVYVKMFESPVVVRLRMSEIGEGLEMLSAILKKVGSKSINDIRFVNLCYSNIAFVRKM